MSNPDWFAIRNAGPCNASRLRNRRAKHPVGAGTEVWGSSLADPAFHSHTGREKQRQTQNTTVRIDPRNGCQCKPPSSHCSTKSQAWRPDGMAQAARRWRMRTWAEERLKKADATSSRLYGSAPRSPPQATHPGVGGRGRNPLKGLKNNKKKPQSNLTTKKIQTKKRHQ